MTLKRGRHHDDEIRRQAPRKLNSLCKDTWDRGEADGRGFLSCSALPRNEYW